VECESCLRGNSEVKRKTAGPVLGRMLTVTLAVFCGTASAQWLHFPTPGIPRAADGKPNLTAPAPRSLDGKPDLSGLWNKSADKFYNNIAADLKPEDVEPWADALYRQRKRDFGKDSMETLCLPLGPAYTTTPYRESRIMQTPTLITILNNDLTHREIFLDGRTLEKDPNPTWMGYSVGRWDGNTLVVESNGYNDKTWLDSDGHPHTEDLRMTERYFRRDFGHLDIEMTLSDPKAYKKPWTVAIHMELAPDTEMLEGACENEKDKAHMTSNSPREEIRVDPAILAKYAGTYDIQSDGKSHRLEIAAAGDSLFYEYDGEGKQLLTALSTTGFSIAGTWLEFLMDGQGAVNDVMVHWVEEDQKGMRRK